MFLSIIKELTRQRKYKMEVKQNLIERKEFANSIAGIFDNWIVIDRHKIVNPKNKKHEITYWNHSQEIGEYGVYGDEKITESPIYNTAWKKNLLVKEIQKKLKK